VLLTPPELAAASEVLEVTVPAGEAPLQTHWPCLPLDRGCFTVAAAVVEGRSPLGLWCVRRRLPLLCEVRVYPNLTRRRNALAALFLNRGQLGIGTAEPLGGPGRSADPVAWSRVRVGSRGSRRW
jgi:uncharacterized protein (DUF58 family)